MSGLLGHDDDTHWRIRQAEREKRRRTRERAWIGRPELRIVSRKQRVKPDDRLSSRQIALLLHRLLDPDGGDPAKIIARLRAGGYDVID